jgi:hypothetical protein
VHCSSTTASLSAPAGELLQKTDGQERLRTSVQALSSRAGGFAAPDIQTSTMSTAPLLVHAEESTNIHLRQQATEENEARQGCRYSTYSRWNVASVMVLGAALAAAHWASSRQASVCFVFVCVRVCVCLRLLLGSVSHSILYRRVDPTRRHGRAGQLAYFEQVSHYVEARGKRHKTL